MPKCNEFCDDADGGKNDEAVEKIAEHFEVIEDNVKKEQKQADVSETENFQEAANPTKANGFEKVVNDKIKDMQTQQVRSVVKVETKGSKVEFKTKAV